MATTGAEEAASEVVDDDGPRGVHVSVATVEGWRDDPRARSTCQGTSTNEDSTRNEELRTACDALIAVDTIDKGAALGIVRLTHRAEMLLLQERHSKDREIARLNHEMEVVRVTSRHADAINEAASESRAIRAEMERSIAALSEAADARDRTVSELQQQLSGLVAMTTGKRGAR